MASTIMLYVHKKNRLAGGAIDVVNLTIHVDPSKLPYSALADLETGCRLPHSIKRWFKVVDGEQAAQPLDRTKTIAEASTVQLFPLYRSAHMTLIYVSQNGLVDGDHVCWSPIFSDTALEIHSSHWWK